MSGLSQCRVFRSFVDLGFSVDFGSPQSPVSSVLSLGLSVWGLLLQLLGAVKLFYSNVVFSIFAEKNISLSLALSRSLSLSLALSRSLSLVSWVLSQL